MELLRGLDKFSAIDYKGDFFHFLFCFSSYQVHPEKGFFVCVEVLQPSQPIGVMSSAVSLANHTFTGQA